MAFSCCLSSSKTWVLRICFIASLLAAAAVCGFVAHTVITRLEGDIAKQTYESVATMALETARAVTLRKFQGGDLMASILSNAFPDGDAWPFVSLAGFDEIASHLALLTSSTTVGLLGVVYPGQAAAFESFAQQVYSEQGYPDTAGVNDFGFGIWARGEASNHSDGRYHDVSYQTSYGSKYEVLTPLFLHNNKEATSLMFNIHSAEIQGSTIDSIFDCAHTFSQQINSTIHTTTRPNCAAVTDFLELIIRPGPSGILYTPVFPLNDPTTVVAIIGTTIHWGEILTSIVPDYIDGLICVVATETETFTYEIQNGQPRVVGSGDLHDPNYSKFAHSIVLNDIETTATRTLNYTLTVYPSETMLAQFDTNSPISVAFGFVGVILFCTAVFFLYDFFVRDESRRRRAVLDVKRRFVRFISHEIRTPLNTVCMGLELLQSELGFDGLDDNNRQQQATLLVEEPGAIAEMASPQESNPLEGTATTAATTTHKNKFKYVLNLTEDIMENAHNAVAILNDLLSYDKIETGTFRLELEPVHVWKLISSVVSSFQMEAKRKNLTLNLVSETTDEESGCGLFDRFIVVGDDTRIRQIIRNLISNAIKFTFDNSAIQVSVRHNSTGLPRAKDMLSSENCGISVNKMCENAPSVYTRAGSVCISVQDQGIGLSNDQLKQLFTEGLQFDVNRLQQGGGSGLGLHISKGLVEQHGGSVFAESDGLNMGATFTVELPLYELSVESKNGHESVKSTEFENHNCTDVATAGLESSISSATEKRHKVLVVEDALTNRKLLVRLLERAGHICAAAVNGQEAVDMFLADLENDESSYDTILLDYEMPVLNGPDTAKKLRELGCKAVIFGVTGNLLAEDVAYFKSMGAESVMAKPVKMSTLDEMWVQYQR